MGRSTVSPQHADLVGMSASETPTRTRPKTNKINCFIFFKNTSNKNDP
ncbi:MAG: hypothetical protein NZ455_00805 [Bacteroidia bacterium]|nr:hypothetical protein [Bacteroidia bacterium]